VEYTVNSLRTLNTVAEDNGGLTASLIQVVIQIQIFLLSGAFDCVLSQSFWHSLLFIAWSKVNHFGVVGAELEDFAELLDGSDRLLSFFTFCFGFGVEAFFFLNTAGCHTTWLVNRHGCRADNVLDSASFGVLLSEFFIFKLGKLFLAHLRDPFIVFFGFLYFFTETLLFKFIHDLIFVVEVFYFGPVNVRSTFFNRFFIRVLVWLFHNFHDFFLIGFLFVAVLFEAFKLVFHLKPLSVNMGENIPHFLEVTVLDHPVSFIKHKHVRHRHRIQQILIVVFRHHLPQATGRRDDNRWLVWEETDLFFCRHATNNRTNLDLVFEIGGNHSLQVVLNLDGQFSGRCDNNTCDPVEILIRVFLKSPHTNVDHRQAKAKSFTLTSFGCNNHINMRLQVHKSLGLYDGWLLKVVSNESLC